MKSMKMSVDKMEAQLNLWSTHIESLAAKAARVGARATIEYRLSIDDLKAKRAVAQLRIDEFKAATGKERLNELRACVESAWNEIEAAFRDLKP